MIELTDYTLEQVTVNIFSGGTPTTTNPEFWNGVFPWLSSGETRNRYINKAEKTITEEGIKKSSTRLAKKNDIIIASAGQGHTRGQTSLSNIDTYVNQSLIVVRANEEIVDSKYLFFNLNNRYEELRKLSDAHSSRGSLTTKLLKGLNIKLPNIQTQRRIVSIIASLDDKIELNNRMNYTLESIAQAIFKEWFVDFRFPGFDGELVDGLPKGWRKESIDKHIDFLNGIALQKYPAENEEDYLPVIKIRELRQGITQSTNKASMNIPKKYIIQDGDVLFSWSGSLDVVIWTNGKGALNQHLFKVSSKLYPKWFCYFWVKENLAKYQKIAAHKATTMGHIQRKHLTETMINVPSENVFAEANKILTLLVEKFIENAVQNMTLIQLRDNLLPKLMSGKIKVKI